MNKRKYIKADFQIVYLSLNDVVTNSLPLDNESKWNEVWNGLL